MATPPRKRSWLVTLPARQRGGLLVLATVAGFVVVAALLPRVAASPDGTIRIALIGALVATALVVSRSRKPAVERRVELPNSHYNPPGVHHEVKITTPWDVIDLDALHEANRGGVEVLLHRARELGPTHLSIADRELLDRMATAARLTAERVRG